MAGEDDGAGGTVPYLYAPGTTAEVTKRIQTAAKDRLAEVADAVGIASETHLIRYVHEHVVDIIGWLLDGDGSVDEVLVALGIGAGEFPFMLGDAFGNQHKRSRPQEMEDDANYCSWKGLRNDMRGRQRRHYR